MWLPLAPWLAAVFRAGVFDQAAGDDPPQGTFGSQDVRNGLRRGEGGVRWLAFQVVVRDGLAMIKRTILAFCAGVMATTSAAAHACVDRILLGDGRLNHALVEEMFGPLGPVSHIASGQGFFEVFRNGAKGDNYFEDLLGREGYELPSGMVILTAGVVDRQSVTLKYQCPVTETPRAVCGYDPAAVSVEPVEYRRPFGPALRPRIQRPETSTGPVAQWALNEARDHYCNYGLSLNELGEPYDLRVFETRPARHALERWSLGMQNDPTPGQYARGMYRWNFQFDVGKFDEFVR
ncbi:MAG: hypothetical protein AAGM21_08170 [Pseudomonadota bacterium]